MKFKFPFIAGYFLLLGACSPANRAEVVSVEIDPEISTPDSALLTDPEIILLETHPQALLSNIEAIDIYQNKLYVTDWRKDKISVFDRKGNFLSTIGRRGRGPGEFSNMIIDFCIDRENDEILIATDRPNRIMYFSLSGEFLGETPMEDLLLEIVKDGNKIYSHLMLYGEYEFAVYELEGRAVKSVKYLETPKLERNPNGGEIVTPFGRMLNASKYGILATRSFDKTIYKVENDELIPFRTIDFGKYYLEEAKTFNTQEISDLTRRNIIYSITNARLTGKDQIIFNGFPNGIFTVNGNTARHYGSLTNELAITANTTIIPILAPETDYIVFSHSALGFTYANRDGRKNTRFISEAARLSQLKEDDNPVLFLYKLK